MLDQLPKEQNREKAGIEDRTETSDTFMDLPGYLENIEHSIKNSFTSKIKEIDDVLIKNRKFGPISNQTFLAIQKSNLSQIILIKSDFICKKAFSFFKNIDLYF